MAGPCFSSFELFPSCHWFQVQSPVPPFASPPQGAVGCSEATSQPALLQTAQLHALSLPLIGHAFSPSSLYWASEEGGGPGDLPAAFL